MIYCDVPYIAILDDLKGYVVASVSMASWSPALQRSGRRGDGARASRLRSA